MLSNSTRRDIPLMGTGPEISDYYAVNIATGEVMQLSNKGHATDVVLVAVPPTHSGEAAQQHARELADQAVALADVVEYAQRPTLSAVTRNSPSIHAMAQARQERIRDAIAHDNRIRDAFFGGEADFKPPMG